jgi:hypothetical protein
VGEANIVLELLRQACRSRLDLLAGDLDVAGVPVELLGIASCRRLATRFDLIEDRLDCVTDGPGIRSGGFNGFLEIGTGHVPGPPIDDFGLLIDFRQQGC